MNDSDAFVEIELALQHYFKEHITAEQAVNTIAHLVMVNRKRKP